MQTSAASHSIASQGHRISKLFDKQLVTLSRRGCPPRIIEKLLFQKTAVIFATCTSGTYIPFLPVIPQRYLTVYSQMGMLRNNDDRGQTQLELSDFEDLGITPQEPYYIYDVDKGDMNVILHSSSNIVIVEEERDLERSIKNQGRHCLTIVEAISLALHTDVLQDSLVRPLASKYGTSLYLRADDDVPVLKFSPKDSINDWCVPSSAFRRCYLK